MQICQLEFQSKFHIVVGNDRSQAAVMALAKGDSTGGPDNRHPDSDQWLYVVSGEVEAVVERQRKRLRPGTLLLVERNEAHEITNAGDEPLEIITIYVPPAYAPQAGKPPTRD
ncbi:MAG: cupin domain-containing protein [Pirellulaceae bacterium]